MAVSFDGIVSPGNSKGPIRNSESPINDATNAIIDGVNNFSNPGDAIPGNINTGNAICITPSPGPGWVCVPHPESVPDPQTGAVKGHWVFQGTITPPPTRDCMLSDYGLALGETPITLNGSIAQHFNGLFTPSQDVIQTNGAYRTEGARRLSESNPSYNFIFVNTGEKLIDKCNVTNLNRQYLVIPATNTIRFVSFYFEGRGYLYIGEDNSLYKLEYKSQSFPVPPTNNVLGSGKIYTEIDRSDIIENKRNVITSGMWSNNVGNLKTFYTSSNQNSGSRLYNLEVRNKIDSDCDSEVQFSISYGNSDGSGSYDLGGKDYFTPSKAVYGQYRSLCLESYESLFSIDGSNARSIYIINAKRSRMGDRMDEGNWELNLAHLSGSQFISGGGNRNAYTGSNIQLGSEGSVLRLIDDSNINPANITSAGEVYKIVSGSIEMGVYNSSNPDIYGLSYPKLGILVLDSTKLDSNAGFLTVTGSEVSASNSHQLLTSISGAALQTDLSGDYKGFSARKETYNYTNHYFIRIVNGEYNFSNNPTYVTGSEGQIHPDFIQTQQVYISQIGLYNKRKELLAVGKISKPIMKNSTEESLFKINLKYQ